MNKLAHFPSVRLATAGYASVVLLAWLGFAPGSSPNLFPRYDDARPIPILVSAAISLFALVVLVPVFWHGPSRNRWLAALAALFPGLTFFFPIFFVQKSGDSGQIHVNAGQPSPRGGVAVRAQAQFDGQNNNSQENT